MNTIAYVDYENTAAKNFFKAFNNFSVQNEKVCLNFLNTKKLCLKVVANNSLGKRRNSSDKLKSVKKSIVPRFQESENVSIKYYCVKTGQDSEDAKIVDLFQKDLCELSTRADTQFCLFTDDKGLIKRFVSQHSSFHSDTNFSVFGSNSLFNELSKELFKKWVIQNYGRRFIHFIELRDFFDCEFFAMKMQSCESESMIKYLYSNDFLTLDDRLVDEEHLKHIEIQITSHLLKFDSIRMTNTFFRFQTFLVTDKALQLASKTSVF